MRDCGAGILSQCLPPNVTKILGCWGRSLLEAVETWILLGKHDRNTLLEIRVIFFWWVALPYDLIDLDLNGKIEL